MVPHRAVAGTVLLLVPVEDVVVGPRAEGERLTVTATRVAGEGSRPDRKVQGVGSVLLISHADERNGPPRGVAARVEDVVVGTRAEGERLAIAATSMASEGARTDRMVQGIWAILLIGHAHKLLISSCGQSGERLLGGGLCGREVNLVDAHHEK